MKVAYVRVSTKEQNEGRQLEALKQYDVERIFSEKVSGKDTANRPQLIAMLEHVRKDDVVYVESISRIARSTRDFLRIIDRLTEKGVALVSLKESIDTSTPQGKFMLTVFAALSQLERETIGQRQEEGIKLALDTGHTKTGRPYGRPKVTMDTTQFKKVYRQYKANELNATQAAKLLGITLQSFYRRVKEQEEASKSQKG